MLWVPTLNSPLKDVLQYYVETISIHKRSYKSEIYRVKGISELIGEIPFNQITPMHIVALRDKRLATLNVHGKPLAASTVKHDLMMISHLFNTAISEWGMDALINPVTRIRKPKTPAGRTRRLSMAEEKRLLKAAHDHQNREFYAVVVIALETAMRQGEILSMQWENIDWHRKTVLLPITKNGDAREVPLSSVARDSIKTRLTVKKTGPVFSYTSSGIKSTWRGFIRGIGIEDFHFHDLRHCAISSLLERGLNAIEVATISGHRSMSMLKRYSHLDVTKLVGKLDPQPKSRKDRPILRKNLPAYPATVTKIYRKFNIEFHDFVDLKFTGNNLEFVMEQAKGGLLRHLVTSLCDGGTPQSPSNPDDILLQNKKSRIEMVSPL